MKRILALTVLGGLAIGLAGCDDVDVNLGFGGFGRTLGYITEPIYYVPGYTSYYVEDTYYIYDDYGYYGEDWWW